MDECPAVCFRRTRLRYRLYMSVKEKGAAGTYANGVSVSREVHRGIE
jgi:hypothetical protein